MRIEVPVAEVVDRLSILLLKTERLPHPMQRANARREYELLCLAWEEAEQPELDTLAEWEGLCAVNAQLWDVEDALRHHEQALDFGPEFVDRARAVYRLNDQRAALKRSLNLRLKSDLIEEKSYGT